MKYVSLLLLPVTATNTHKNLLLVIMILVVWGNTVYIIAFMMNLITPLLQIIKSPTPVSQTLSIHNVLIPTMLNILDTASGVIICITSTLATYPHAWIKAYHLSPW
jgi:phage-related protein